MCHFLKLSKSTYYFNLKKKNKIQNNIYEQAVISAFKKNKEVYGTRRLKVILENQEIYLSRRKIKEIMNKHNLISKYTKLSFKNYHNKVNDSQITNLVNRNFNNRVKNEVIVSDLTYVQVNGKWNYWMGYTLLDTNYVDKWTKKGTIIMANINSYTDEFKKQIVALYQSGKSVSCLAKEYNVTRAATYNWIKQFTNSGSFKTKDNRSVEENELIKLRKELKQLRMENDILKQAALIIGRK